MASAKEGHFWAEETLQNFREVILCTNDQPTNGKIYVMYHGTTLAAAIKIIKDGFMRPIDGMLGKGVYVSRDIEKAARYPPDDRWDQVILKLRVNVGNVKMIDHQNYPLQKTWHKEGYDTAWVPEYSSIGKSGLEKHCVWDPDRIKVVGIARAPPLSVPNYLDKKFLTFQKN